MHFLLLSQTFHKDSNFHEASNVLFFLVTFKTALAAFFIVTSEIYMPITYVIIKTSDLTYCQQFISTASCFPMLRVED